MKRYAVLFQQDQDGWTAHVPDLAGCISAGKTYAEANERIREAILIHVRTLARLGQEIPEPATRVGVVELEVESSTQAAPPNGDLA